MGTRGAWGFRIDGIDKIGYNHFDSYPTALGQDVYSFCLNNTNRLPEIARKIELVSERTPSSDDDILYVRKFEKAHGVEICDLFVSNKDIKDRYCLFRGAQGNMGLYASGFKYMIDGKDFLFDSLFCEYAYIINIDSGMLEFYEGLVKTPGNGRYVGMQDENGYYGVTLVKETPLAELKNISTEQCFPESE